MVEQARIDEARWGGGSVGRGVLAIVATGIVLGAAYNHYALEGRPSRGLPWIAEPTVLPAIEDVTASAPAESMPARATNDTGTLAAATATPLATPLATDDAQDRSPVSKPPGGAPPRAPAAGALSAAADVEAKPAAAPVELPSIPETGGPFQVQLPSAKRFFDAKAALFLDARDPAEFGEGHIAGAINLPYEEAITDPDRLAAVDSGGKVIITYCGGGTCEVSISLAEALVHQAGKKKVLVFMGGYPEWEQAGYPVEPR